MRAGSPSAAFVEFLTQMAPEIALDLALRLGRMFPGKPFGRAADPQAIRTWVSVLATDAESDAGLACTMGALTDVVLYEMGDEKEWAKREAMLGLLDQLHSESQEQDEAIAAFIDNLQLRQPFRARQWAKAAEAWQTLRSTTLSTESIYHWLEKARIDDLAHKTPVFPGSSNDG